MSRDSLNLWLSEHLDLQLFGEIEGSGASDILVHNALLSKYRPGVSQVFSPMSAFANDELTKYFNWISQWDRDSRTRFHSGFPLISDDSDDFQLDSRLFGAVERLFYHCKFGCIAAGVFFSRISALLEGKKLIRFIVGEHYRMTELIALIWWLSLCRIRFDSLIVEYIWVSRKSRFKKTRSLDELLRWLSASCRVDPTFHGEVPTEILSGESQVCLAWVSTIQYPRGWDLEIKCHGGDPNKALRITQVGQSHRHESPCVEIHAGDGGALENLEKLLKIAEQIQGKVKEDLLETDLNPCFEPFGAAVEKYFLEGVAPLVFKQISKTADLLERKFSSLEPGSFFSATAPLMESLGVHEWVARQDPSPSPVLVPHSFTSSHEFPADSYRSSLTFVSSKNLMPSVFDDPKSLDKEELVSLEKIQNRHQANSSQKTNALRGKVNLLAEFLRLHKGQIMPLLRDRMKRFCRNACSQRSYGKIIPTKRIKLGFLLNFEHYEFYIGVDFKKFFQGIAELVMEMEDFYGSDAALILRRKPGWTNLELLNQVLRENRKDAFADTLLTSPSSSSLLQFGGNCDAVLCFQGTSAIPELMLHGVPCIFLDSDHLPIKLDPDYIVIPQDVVPLLEMKTILSNIEEDSQWAAKLGETQREWINLERKVENSDPSKQTWISASH